MLKNNKSNFINLIKQKCKKNNMFIISFLIFLPIPITIGITLGTERMWYDVVSIISIFYIGLPILFLIFTMNEKGWIRKIFDLFKFKEIKKIKNSTLSKEEEEKIKILSNLDNTNKDNLKSELDLVFVSIVLMIYGLLLLIITLPSLILFLIK